MTDRMDTEALRALAEEPRMTLPITDDLRKLRDEITPGPWTVSHPVNLQHPWITAGDDGFVGNKYMSISGLCEPSDARAIALVPTLLSEVIDLRGSHDFGVFWRGEADKRSQDLDAARAAVTTGRIEGLREAARIQHDHRYGTDWLGMSCAILARADELEAEMGVGNG